MFCKACGAQLSDQATFCPNCGAAQQPAQVQPTYQQPVQQPVYQQPVQQSGYPQQPIYQQSVYGQPLNTQPPLGMKWFKFLIYFSLFAGAVLNLIGGLQYLTGAHYGGTADLVYQHITALKALDVAMALATLILAGFGVYVRFRLAGYHANGPKLLNILYIAAPAISLAYLFAANGIVENSIIGETVNLLEGSGSVWTNVVVSIVMVFVNTGYFKKRAHLFVN